MTDKDDHELFKQAMAGVKPLRSKNIIPTHHNPPKKIRIKAKIPDQENTIYLSDHCAEDILPEQFISFAKPGMQPRYFKQLKQGKIPIEAELDLHGYTIDKAREEFLKFLQLSQNRGYRCIHIIHGKGYRSQNKTPALKSKIFTWLKQLPNILAFCSCQPKDGGTGAVYVLLGQLRKE